MKRRHEMPFGASVLENGQVQFQIWAPASQQVDLILETGNSEVVLPMTRTGDGWFGLQTAQARADSRYRYRINGQLRVPDPASRSNPDDINGACAVVDPMAYDWQDGDWRGRPWEEAVIYELHVGTFTPEGTFAGVRRRLGHLADLGITAIELMPVADFPGMRNWGYDGVLPFAPDSSYGSPGELKDLIQSAHGMGIMVLLDVVYNHFGPEGNYLHAYAPQFFNDRHHTPWGAAINFDGPDSRTVRDFFIHNARYWLEEYHFDGLRLDAVHAICDDSEPDILIELADAIRRGPGRERQVHLVLENDNNASRYLQRLHSGHPRWYSAQWNDDEHHALHVIATGERDGYYADYAEKPLWYLGRCLTQGFAYQGEPSAYRNDANRGEPSADLPPSAFVSFLQTHDQVGNRALGERLTALAKPETLRALAAVLLLAPQPPMLFMGDEFGAATPVLFFCDFHGELAESVRTGRRREFGQFERFRGDESGLEVPDPNALATFERSKLDWNCLTQPEPGAWLQLHRRLLSLRNKHVTPLVPRTGAVRATFEVHGNSGIIVTWVVDGMARLRMLANLGDNSLKEMPALAAMPFYASHPAMAAALNTGVFPPWSVVWVSDRIRMEMAA